MSTYGQLCNDINDAHASDDLDTLCTLLLDFGMRRATKQRRDLQDSNGIAIREDLPADMVQEFVLRVLEKMHTFDPKKHRSFAHWLNTTIRNRNADIVGEEADYYGTLAFAGCKARSNEDGDEESEQETLERLAHEYDDDDRYYDVADRETKAVAEAICADPFMLAVAKLRATEEYTDAEIAEKLGVTLDMFKGRVKRFTAKWGGMAYASKRIRRRVRRENEAEKKVA